MRAKASQLPATSRTSALQAPWRVNRVLTTAAVLVGGSAEHIGQLHGIGAGALMTRIVREVGGWTCSVLAVVNRTASQAENG